MIAMDGAIVVSASVTLWLLVLRSRRTSEQHAAQQRVTTAIRSADERLSWSALHLARAIREGEVTSLALTEMYIAQLNRVNPDLKAVVGTRFEAARAEAGEADRRVAVAQKLGADAVQALPPLLGVPFVAKEVHEYPGMPFSGGLVGCKDRIGARLNPVLGRLEAQGAIVLCSGNTSEACMWSESENPVHGRSNMPYDLSRTCGGSSGGTASALSALCGAFSITSDVGGSTRIPALYNGLFGHKPTGGAVPNTRSSPTIHGVIERYCQLGPCTRHAEDLFPLLQIIAGPTQAHEIHDADEDERALHAQQEQHMREFEFKDPREVDLRKVTFKVLWEQPGAVLGPTHARHPDMLAAQQRVVQALESSLDCRVESVTLPRMASAFDIWSAMMQEAQGDHSFVDMLSEGLPEVSPFWELVKKLFTGGHGSPHTLPALGLAVAEKLKDLTPEQHKRMLARGAALRDELHALLEGDTVLVFPGLPQPAPTHGPLPNLFYFGDFGATGILNVMELPATTVPMGLSRREGIPVGAQIVANNGHDHLTIAVAMHLEKLGVAKWQPPRASL